MKQFDFHTFFLLPIAFFSEENLAKLCTFFYIFLRYLRFTTIRTDHTDSTFTLVAYSSICKQCWRIEKTTLILFGVNARTQKRRPHYLVYDLVMIRLWICTLIIARRVSRYYSHKSTNLNNHNNNTNYDQQRYVCDPTICGFRAVTYLRVSRVLFLSVAHCPSLSHRSNMSYSAAPSSATIGVAQIEGRDWTRLC